MKKILFIHQNFPGQFKYLATALADCGYSVYALVQQRKPRNDVAGVKLFEYRLLGSNTAGLDPWLVDFESKLIRAKSVCAAATALKARGFQPEAIIAHPGWGEALFIKNVWPDCKLGVYCEWYYQPRGYDVGFDQEFPPLGDNDSGRLSIKNMQFLLQEESVDSAICPTKWQASTFPSRFQAKISVIHEGIDTEIARPNAEASLELTDGDVLSQSSRYLTFVNRTLEPYRGYHSFMRSLPNILKQHSDLKVLIVGGTEGGYGALPPNGKTWKDIFWDDARGQLSDSDASRVIFLGKLPYDAYLKVLQLSTVHVYLTYPFVLSWSLLEAMSVACSVVASETGPVTEVIEDDKTGVLVDFFDPDAISAAVSKLLNDEKKRVRISESARAKMLEQYDLTIRCLPQQLLWVEDLLGKRGL